MKLFLDTADVTLIKQWASTELIDGVTTNPTHLSKAGGSPRAVVQNICTILPQGDISVEVTESKPDMVYEQAKNIARLAKNVVVKIPCHKDYYSVIARLVDEGIRVNITLVFSVSQALCMFKLHVTYISPFVGRLDDAGADGMRVLQDMCNMRSWYGYESQILAASIRDVKKAEAALMAGVDALTVPPAVFDTMIQHSLTDAGMKQFATDWSKLDISTFP